MCAAAVSEIQIIRSGLVQSGILSESEAAAASVTHFAQGLFVLYRIDAVSRAPFVAKLVSSPDMARAEWDGLCALREAGALVPELLGISDESSGGASGRRHSVLFLGLVQPGRPRDFSPLARLYSTRHESYGYPRDNYVGSLPQKSGRYATFFEFFWRTRLLPQLESAVSGGFLEKSEIREAESVTARVCEQWKLDDARPRLIHGDLWNGNLLFNEAGEAVLIDPSVSFAHPEQDLAMLWKPCLFACAG